VYQAISTAPQHPGHQVGADREPERHEPALEGGGQPLVDAEGDEGGARHLGGGAHDDDEQGEDDAAAHGPQQRPEQTTRPRPDLPALVAGVVAALFAFHAGDAHFSTSRVLSGSSDEIT
jgi:hypothetical protein